MFSAEVEMDALGMDGNVDSNAGGVTSAVATVKVWIEDWTLSVCPPPRSPLSSRASTYTS